MFTVVIDNLAQCHGTYGDDNNNNYTITIKTVVLAGDVNSTIIIIMMCLT